MRLATACVWAACVWGLISMCGTARAQSFPAAVAIIAPEVEARSGPSQQFYATAKLRAGNRVYITREVKDQPGWLEIMPPPRSFSWINTKHVRVSEDQLIGIVHGEPSATVPVKAGSTVVNATPNVVSDNIKVGSIVVFVDTKAKVDDGESYLPIQPHPTERRFLPASAVRLPQPAAGASGAGPSGAAASGPAAGRALIAQADRAFQIGDHENARRLYKQAADSTSDNQQKAYCYGQLARLDNVPAASAAPKQPANTGWMPPGVIGASNPNPGPAPGVPASLRPGGNLTATSSRWSPWGLLRRANFDKDGQPVYVLENSRGTALLYATTQTGFSLKDYVGRTVCLYGPIHYRSDDYLRSSYMIVTHVAVP